MKNDIRLLIEVASWTDPDVPSNQPKAFKEAL